jgi:GNAT superfamily N-acetyltransferase
MTVRIATDARHIRRLLEPVVLKDPVRNTIFATIRADLRRSGDGAWSAFDGPALAARSSPVHPIALTAGWADLSGLATAIGELPVVAGVGGPVPAVEELVRRLGRAAAHRTAERLYRLERLRAPKGVPGTTRAAEPGEADLIVEWYSAFTVEAHGGVPSSIDVRGQVRRCIHDRRCLVWVDGCGPVSMAMLRPPEAGVSRIGPVYTPPSARAHGYGSAVTAGAARAILATGAVPVLYADRANPTSNRIYQAIGFRPVADRASVRF